LKKGLGKGLGALMQDVSLSSTLNQGINEEFKHIISNILLKDIRPNPFNPRQDFESIALEELKSSITTHGLIQPITVRKVPQGYELISGERRYRAFKELNLENIPAYVIEVESDSVMLELAIIENVQRENLNPIEVANGYQRLIEEHQYTQEKVAERVGKQRSTITNSLRLLKLPLSVQDHVRDKKLSMGQARALLSLENYDEILDASQFVIDHELSVRDTEKYVKGYGQKNKSNQSQSRVIRISDETKTILNDKSEKLMHRYGTNVRITAKTEETGKIEIDFYSKEDFQRIIELLEKK